MNAAVVEGLSRMEVKDVPVPDVRNGTLLMRVKICAVCGSDIRILNSGNDRVSYPAIIGHEIAGEVIEVGKNVTGFNPGDVLSIGADVPCGKCSFCQNGMGNCCDNNFAMGYQFQGGFAEYCLLEPMVINYGPVAHVPNGVSLESASLAEPLACCINGFERVSFSPGKSVMIMGAGPIGIMLAKVAFLFGASLVVLGDINTNRLKAASTVSGADFFLNLTENDWEEKILDMTKGKGIDFVFTACPSPDAQEAAVRIIAKRGVVNLFGGLADSARDIKINSNMLHYREAYLTGSHGSTPKHHRMALDLITTNRIDLSSLITHRFSLDEINRAFDTVQKQKGFKILVLPNE